MLVNLIDKVFNVRDGEWHKIAFSWGIKFFYRFGFVMGWTVLVAMFTAQYKIFSLPYLFAAIGLFTILGSIFYSTFIDRYSKESLMMANIFGAGVVLLVAPRLLGVNQVLFFMLLIMAIAVFLVQFKIASDAFIEEQYEALQSERIFPLIESADTIGGIFAGLTVFLLANHIDGVRFIYLWIIALFLIIPLLLLHGHVGKEKKNKTAGVIAKFKKAVKDKKHFSFVRGLFLIVFFQWVLFNMLEFQYTKAVYENVSSVVLEAGSGFEHAFIHDLGVLFAIFSGSALVVQLFVGSRLISSLGVIGSMLLHPIVTLMSLFGLTTYFNFTTAALAKNNFTITTVIHTNAYHSAYYAIQEDSRENFRELMEGVIRPLGALFGTLVLIFLQVLFVDASLIFYLNLFMIFVAVAMVYIDLHQQEKYSQIAVDDLLHAKSYPAKLNAIDILAQKGHKNSRKLLEKIAEDDSEPPKIRKRAFQALKEFDII